MSSGATWKQLLSQLEVIPSASSEVIRPVGVKALNAFERTAGVALPESYREYCRVFGAGQIANQFMIAVPSFKGRTKTYCLEYLTKSQVALAPQYAESQAGEAQLTRGLFFGLDIAWSNYFFDPTEITSRKPLEYAVFVIFRDCEVRRLTNSFRRFVLDFCLGKKHDTLIDTPPSKVFRPVG